MQCEMMWLAMLTRSSAAGVCCDHKHSCHRPEERTTENLAEGRAASLRPNRRTYGAGSPAAGLGAVPGAAPTLMPLMQTGSSKRTCAVCPGKGLDMLARETLQVRLSHEGMLCRAVFAKHCHTALRITSTLPCQTVLCRSRA